jgi:hypothetical protein
MAFEQNPIILHTERYINDLGHEFKIASVVEGVYWSGGAWGSGNGFDNYYGNVYFSLPTYQFNDYDAPTYQISDNYATVPEPSTLLIIGTSAFFLKK